MSVRPFLSMLAVAACLAAALSSAPPARASTALCYRERVHEQVYLFRHLQRSGNLIGVIVKAGSRRLLVLGDYVASRHEHLVAAAERVHGPVTERDWYGELGLSPALQFTEINPTSGAWKATQQKELNPVERAKHLLEQYRADLLDPRARATPYDPKNEHLNPKAHSVSEYVRHDLQNDVTAPMGFLELFHEVLASREEDPFGFALFTERHRGTFSEEFSQAKLQKIEGARRFLASHGYIPNSAGADRLFGRLLAARSYEDLAHFSLSEIDTLGDLLMAMGRVVQTGRKEILIIPLDP
jgi:hypothetical protein